MNEHKQIYDFQNCPTFVTMSRHRHHETLFGKIYKETILHKEEQDAKILANAFTTLNQIDGISTTSLNIALQANAQFFIVKMWRMNHLPNVG